jgi:hypothetical protein
MVGLKKLNLKFLTFTVLVWKIAEVEVLLKPEANIFQLGEVVL